MNTLEELKSLHQRIGHLVDLLDSEQLHQKLMSLIGRCRVIRGDSEIVAERITKVEIKATWRKETTVILHEDGVRCYNKDGAMAVEVYGNERHLTVQQALCDVDLRDSTIIKEAQFEHIKTVLLNRMDTLWHDLKEVAAV